MDTSNFQKNEKEFLFQGSKKPPRGFSVPDGYFKSFEQQMLEKIKNLPAVEETTVVKPIEIQKIISVMAIAASIIWAAFVLFTPEEEFPMEDTSSMYAEVEDLSIDDFYELDDYILAENISLAQLEDISFDEDYLSEEEIYEYLLDENYTEFEIIENLKN